MPSSRRPGLASIHIYVEPDVKAAAADRARERGETLTDVIARALRRYAAITARGKQNTDKETP